MVSVSVSMAQEYPAANVSCGGLAGTCSSRVVTICVWICKGLSMLNIHRNKKQLRKRNHSPEECKMKEGGGKGGVRHPYIPPSLYLCLHLHPGETWKRNRLAEHLIQ